MARLSAIKKKQTNVKISASYASFGFQILIRYWCWEKLWYKYRILWI